MTMACSSRENLQQIKPSPAKARQSYQTTNFNNVSKTSLDREASTMKKLWLQETRSLCQLNLLKELLFQKVGTSQVETQVNKMSSTNKSCREKPAGRNVKLIVTIMKSKAEDARKKHREATIYVRKCLRMLKRSMEDTAR